MKQKQKQTNVFIKTSGGCVITVRNDSFIDSKEHSLEPTQKPFQRPYMHYTGIYMNVSVTTVLELEEHNEDNMMWCLYFVYTILICFVKTIIFFENFLYKVFF